MGHELNIFLLCFGLLQGLLLGFYLLKTKKRVLANVYFVLILFVVGSQLTFKIVSKIWLMEHTGFFYALSYCLPYLIGPLLYLYVKARIYPTLKKTDWLHATPFICATLLTIVHRFFISNWICFSIIYPYRSSILEVISLGIYTYLSWKLIQNSNQKIDSLKSFVINVALAEFVVITTMAFMYMYYGRFPDVRLLFVALTALIYWISYKQISKPDLFVVMENPVVALTIGNYRKYANSGLRSEEAQRISDLLQQSMSQHKLFTQTDLTIDALSVKLNVPRHHISQVLNERFHKSYFDFINDFRLEEVKIKLENHRFNHFTISAIAMDSGFKSVSGFNDLFKRHIGMTPSKFREQRQVKMTA